MLKIDIEHLLFSRAFLDLKYGNKSRKIVDNIKKKYNNNKLSFLDVDLNIDTKKIKKFVQEKKSIYNNIVVLGMGGSSLGTKAILQAIKGKYYNELSLEQRGGFPRQYIIDNIDPSEINSILQIIDLSKTLFIVISKSGGTIETMSQYIFLKNYLKNKGLDILKHFVIIAGERSNFKYKSIKEGFEVFDIPDGIGGRFSALTNVSLLPLAFAGINIDNLLKGVTKSKDKFLSNNLFENTALLTSIIQYHTYYELSKNITVFFPYSSNLFYFGEWYRQMIGESLGKGGTGVTLTSAIGVTDQHSQLQLYYDGPNDKLLIFLEVEDFGVDFNICCDDRFTFAELMKTEKFGTMESVSSYNKLNYTLNISKLDEINVGELIIMLEMQTVFLGELYGFNPFDQPGVEIGKNITKKKLSDNIGKIDFLENKVKKNILTLGGGNGQSSFIKLFTDYLKYNGLGLNIGFNMSSVVAMSDDGRTTGELMKLYKKRFLKHLPPPGDLRRIIFTYSKSKYKNLYIILFESIFKSSENISNVTLLDYIQIISRELLEEGRVTDFKKVLGDIINKRGDIYNNFKSKFGEYKDCKLDINSSLKGHKLGNLLIANLYNNSNSDLGITIEILKNILSVDSGVFPVTSDEATIYAKLVGGSKIFTQDKISNGKKFDFQISDIDFIEGLKPNIFSTLVEQIFKSDYLIITPGDLYTSLLVNFKINGFKEALQNSNIKIILILNANNKRGETTNYKICDFIDTIEKVIGDKKISYVIGNKSRPLLTEQQKQDFKNDISVKGGDYLILDDNKKKYLQNKYPYINFINGEYINSKDLYRYNSNLIADLIDLIR